MIVDDDRTTVRLLKTLLELDGFEVAVAGLGADAIAQVGQVRPDLILVDYRLHDMDGLQVVKALRKRSDTAGVPIVMASGMNVEAEALKAGASRFLVKPLEPNALPRLFHELIGQRA